MAAKRLVPVLHILEGRVVDPGDGSVLGLPSQWARRLEMEGADEVLFVERGRGRRHRQAWLNAVAGALFIPFALEAPFADATEVAEALEDGADKVVVAEPQAVEAHALGRTRITASLEAVWSETDGWSKALAALDALAQAGAGEILLSAGSQNLPELCRELAHLSTPVLLRCQDPGDAVVALAHGADGIAFPAGLRTASEFKDLLGAAEVTLRR